MTGFGRATYEDSTMQLWVEVKSYNAKNLDIYVQLPSELNSHEITIRNNITQRFSRGKIELRVGLTSLSQSLTLQPSAVQVLQTLSEQMKEANLSLQVSLKDLQQFGLLSGTDISLFEKPLISTVMQALDAMASFRQTEGSKHKEALDKDFERITEAIVTLEERQEEAIHQIQKRFLDAMAQYQLNAVINEQRFMEEVSYYLVKNSIKEEIIRLKSHLEAGWALLILNEPIGRRLDFLAQEMNREANTIASKSEDIHIKQATLIIKESIDSIREQGRNIE